MSGALSHGPSREASPSWQGGPSPSPRAARLSPLGGSRSTEHSAPASVGEAQELVLREVALQVLREAVEARAQKEAPGTPPHQQGLYSWADQLPSRHEEQLPWALAQTEALRLAAFHLLMAGNLLIARGTRHQTAETHSWSEGQIQNQHLVEIAGQSSWVVGALRELSQGVTWWTEKDYPELQEAWPRDLDLGSLWLTGATDMAGDQLLLLQGSREQVMAASLTQYPAMSAAGRSSLIVCNTMVQQLWPIEAAILVPGALESDSLFVLFGG